MKIKIYRQACCAADDQLGPLDTSMEIEDKTTLEDVAKRIASTGFLQFSSTHHTIHGYSSEKKLVSIGAPFSAGATVSYYMQKDALAREVIQDGSLSFLFSAN